MTTEVATPDWSTWTSQIPEEIRSESALSRYKTIGDLAKSHLEAQKVIGGSIKIPKDDAPQAERDAFLTKLGRPAKPEDYRLERPSNLPEGMKYDEEREQVLRTSAHSHGVSDRALQGMLKDLTGYEVQSHTDSDKRTKADRDKAEQKVKADREATISQLKNDWGNDFDKNLGAAKNAIRVGGGKEFLQFLEDNGLADHPGMVKFAAWAADGKSEEGLVTGMETAQSSRDEIQGKIDAIQMDKNHAYNNPKAPSTARQAAIKEVSALFKQLGETQAA